jgi:hypothetical protein
MARADVLTLSGEVRTPSRDIPEHWLTPGSHHLSRVAQKGRTNIE